MDLKAFWESSRSTIIAAIVALVVIGGLFVVFNVLPANETSTDIDEEKEEQIDKEEEARDEGDSENGTVELPSKYAVVAGDHLWKISTKFYDTGFNWTLIAQENRLANPDIIHSGNVLTIPKADKKISGKTHTVVRGDTVWDIAHVRYGSGFDWTKLRDANTGKIGTLPNGNVLINPGQILSIPR